MSAKLASLDRGGMRHYRLQPKHTLENEAAIPMYLVRAYLEALLVGKDVLEKGCLASSQKSREQGDGRRQSFFVCSHDVFTSSALLASVALLAHALPESNATLFCVTVDP